MEAKGYSGSQHAARVSEEWRMDRKKGARGDQKVMAIGEEIDLVSGVAPTRSAVWK